MRSFLGHATELPGTCKLNGVIVHGWEMQVPAMHIVLRAYADGVPREVDVTGAASMQQHMGKASSLPAAPLLAALSREALDLLAVLLRKHPASVTELAEPTGRAASARGDWIILEQGRGEWRKVRRDA